MPDTPTYSLDQYTYDQKLAFYNAERRENVGGSNVWKADGSHYWDNNGATLNKFLFNASQEDISTPITLCSFANGVTLKWTYNHNNFVLDDLDNWHTSISYQYYDKDDVAIAGQSGDVTLYYAAQYVNPTSAYFLYTPPNLDYNLGYSDNPTAFAPGGSIFTPRYYKDFSGSTPPDIHGMCLVRDRNRKAGNGAYWQRENLGYSPAEDFNAFMSMIIGNGDDTPITPKKPEDDPSKPSDPGTPVYDPESDPVPFPDLPTGGGGLGSGFLKAYNPTSNQLQSLAAELWSDDFVTNIKKVLRDPMEGIISLHSVPFKPSTSSSVPAKIGNYTASTVMPPITTQWYKVDMGSIYIPLRWGSALDFSPYCTVDIFLPYVGIKQIYIDDCMGKYITVQYNIDVISGAFIAHVMCDESVLYAFNGSLSYSIPITGSSYAQFYANVIGTATMATTAAITGSPAAVGGAITSAINTVTSKRADVSRAGSLSGNAGCLGEFTPYLIIHRPEQSLAAGFAHFKGYPSNITGTIGGVSGYTEIESIHLENIGCTDLERDEIQALLYNGILA